MKEIIFYSIGMMCCALFSTGCKDSATTKSEREFENLSSASLGCIQDPPLEKSFQEGELIWYFEDGILRLHVDFTTHCEPEFVNTVTFAGNTITIMLEDIAESAARCICVNREEFNIKVVGTSNVRIVCNVKLYGTDSFEQIIDHNISL